jgi:hypothetical protein
VHARWLVREQVTELKQDLFDDLRDGDDGGHGSLPSMTVRLA